ncbi:MAG: 4Fe-4S dicluster domain-containing protein [Coriobacteriia bacterium]|nr:4Fe-4S dicluster domain-containing protein [Coriobacteriia bacterium]
MGYIITGMALKNLFSKPVTKRYPHEPIVYTERTRGHVYNDMEKCIICSICEKACPAGALGVDKEARTWTIDRFSCVQCGACVRSCPPKAQSLIMKPEYAPVATKMTSEVFTKPEDSLED